MRGVWLARPYWGRGLMTEAVERVTAYAFEDLGWPFLYLSNAGANVGSRRVKEKQGATLVDETSSNFVEGLDVRQTWRLDRDAWLARGKPNGRIRTTKNTKFTKEFFDGEAVPTIWFR